MARLLFAFAAMAALLVACEKPQQELRPEGPGSSKPIPLSVAKVEEGEFLPRALYEQPTGCSFDPNALLNSDEKLLTPDEQLWVSEDLAKVGQKPLVELYNHAGRATIYVRFIWLPTFDNPLISTLGIEGEDTGTMRVDEIGRDRATSSSIARTPVERALTAAELQEIGGYLMPDALFDERAGGCETGIDGSIWLIEIVSADGYRFIRRWSPQEGDVLKFGTLILKMAGPDAEAIY